MGSSATAVSVWPVTETSGSRTSAWRFIFLYISIALAATLYLFPFMHLLSGAPDEGIYLYNAQRVMEGGIPGRDFIQENPPLAYYWLALFFKLFGTSFNTARMLLLATGIGTTVAVFHLARRRGSSGIFTALWVMVTAIPLMPINSPHYDSNFFALLGFCFFLCGADGLLDAKWRGWAFVVAGLLEGATSCILQQKGALFLFAFLVSLTLMVGKKAIKPTLLMIAAFLAVGVVELIPFAMWGALGDLFLSCVVIPLKGYDSLNKVEYGFPLWTVWFPSLFAQLRANASLWIAIPILVVSSVPFLMMVFLPVVLAVVGFFWRSRVFAPKLLPYWITGCAMWLSELHRQDLSHLRHGCKIFVVLFYILFERYGSRIFRYVALIATSGTLLMGFTALNGALHANAPIFTRRGLMLAHEPDRVLDFLISHTKAGDYAFVHPYRPIYYFAADLRNPTRLSTIVDQRRNGIIDEAIRQLDAAKPRYAVADTKLLGDNIKTMFPAFVPPPPEERVIDRYLDAHYHQIEIYDGVRILERNPN